VARLYGSRRLPLTVGLPESAASAINIIMNSVVGILRSNTRTLGIPYAQNVKGLPYTLVISITGDSTTPHQGGIKLAETLGSDLLTVEGEGHTVVSSGKNTCVDTITSDYLIDLKLPEKMPTCSI
jgi:hypothetical protein